MHNNDFLMGLPLFLVFAVELQRHSWYTVIVILPADAGSEVLCIYLLTECSYRCSCTVSGRGLTTVKYK